MNAEQLLELIHTEIPGVTGAAVGSIDAGSFSARAWGTDLVPLRADLVAMVNAWRGAYDALGGPVDFGSNDEILVSASKGYLLVRVHHGSGRFVAVLLSASGNIGYLRFRVREYLRAAAGL